MVKRVGMARRLAGGNAHALSRSSNTLPGIPMLKNLAALVLTFTVAGAYAAEKAPLKVMLITGGCCHDYKTQKDIIKTGLQARINCVVSSRKRMRFSSEPPYRSERLLMRGVKNC